MISVAAESWWLEVTGPDLAQGDYLPDCLVPVFDPAYGNSEDTTHDVVVDTRNCIIVTQTCDLENSKAPFVALCPLHAIADFEEVNPPYKKRGEWEQVRKGRREGLHLIASVTNPDDNHECFVADFREIYSLPIDYLNQHAHRLGRRWRLRSPFLEHFSQAFARFFMRVGLPSSIPPFK